MGTECSVLVTAHDETQAARLLDEAFGTIAGLEQLWSRFRPDSELSAINRSAGEWLAVDPDTFALLDLSISAWRFTEGLVDPSLLDALLAAGYDRTFDELASAPASRRSPSSDPARRIGPDAIELDRSTGRVRVPAPLQLDLGGFGKGRTADLLISELRRGGAIGACVDMGGDIRTFGRRASDGPWVVGVDDPFHPGTDLAVLLLDDGAVATSSIARRRWSDGETAAHHLIDPRTGEPAATDLVSVTVVAADAFWAEVFAKSALIAGELEGGASIRNADLSGLMVTADGHVLTVGAIDRYLSPVAGAA